jgi:hypothetical protein
MSPLDVEFLILRGGLSTVGGDEFALNSASSKILISASFLRINSNISNASSKLICAVLKLKFGSKNNLKMN